MEVGEGRGQTAKAVRSQTLMMASSRSVFQADSMLGSVDQEEIQGTSEKPFRAFPFSLAMGNVSTEIGDNCYQQSAFIFTFSIFFFRFLISYSRMRRGTYQRQLSLLAPTQSHLTPPPASILESIPRSLLDSPRGTCGCLRLERIAYWRRFFCVP